MFYYIYYLSKTVDFLNFVTLTFLLARRYGCPLRYHMSSFCRTMFYLWELHVVYVWLCICVHTHVNLWFKINNWKTFAKDYIMSRNVTATSLLRSIFLFLLWRIAISTHHWLVKVFLLVNDLGLLICSLFIFHNLANEFLYFSWELKRIWRTILGFYWRYLQLLPLLVLFKLKNNKVPDIFFVIYTFLATTKVFLNFLIFTALVFMVNLYHLCKQGSSVWIVGYLQMDGPLIMILLAGCTSPRTQHSSRVEKLVKFSQLWWVDSWSHTQRWGTFQMVYGTATTWMWRRGVNIWSELLLYTEITMVMTLNQSSIFILDLIYGPR